MLVKDIMTRNLITIDPETSFTNALKIMRENKIRRLPVLEGKKLVGIVTEKDILYASPSKATTLDVWELHYLLNKLKVKEIMTKNVITVQEDTPIEEAARIMVDNKIGALPVLKEDELVGIVTETDIFKIFLEMFGARKKGVRYTFKLPNVPGTFAKLSQKIFEAGGNIVSLASYGENEEIYTLVMKVEKIDHNKFMESMKDLKDVKLVHTVR
ncbi:MAG TPA: CBS domain-containing protein [Thermotoga sp.]|nr:CBS domain-containing protein [Thermotoga sp.]